MTCACDDFHPNQAFLPRLSVTRSQHPFSKHRAEQMAEASGSVHKVTAHLSQRPQDCWDVHQATGSRIRLPGVLRPVLKQPQKHDLSKAPKIKLNWTV